MTRLSKRTFSSFFRKSSIGSIFFFLLFVIYQFAGALHSESSVLKPPEGEPVEFYSNQTKDSLHDLYLSAINHAKQSIVLIIYSLNDPRVIAALQEKSHEGVPVYIVSDAKASPGLSRKLPGATIVRRITKGITHQKILVIDHKIILLGSANLTGESLRTHGNLVFQFKNPLLAEAIETKALSMDEEGGSTPLLHQSVLQGSQHLELWMLPDDPAAVKRIVSLIRSAKKTIRVAMFTWTRNDFVEELIAARQRGVQVQCVIDRYSAKGASAKIVRSLTSGGIETHTSTGRGLLHHKFIFVDDEVIANGSANWTYSAFKWNDDCFIVLYPLTNFQKIKMNVLWETIWTESENL